MKFAHLGDCHLGGWRQPELRALNLLSFQTAVERCINQQVDFVLIAGDLFDSAYPSIETLKETFSEFRKLRDAKIPVFLIAGSHDYSVSGKSFLDVLEKAGLCKNVSVFEEKDEKLFLQPTLYNNVAIYGYPGKKSGLEVNDIENIKLQDAPGFFKILMLHTAIKDAVPTLPIPTVDQDKLPKVDYLALSHLHINYAKENRVYSGPIFPNNLPELEELQGGMFYIYENRTLKKEEIKLKSILSLNIKITDSLTATDKIIEELKKEEVKDKIIILKLSGILESGKTSDINFNHIESYLKGREAYIFLKTTTKLHLKESEVKLGRLESKNLEDQIISKFRENNPSKFNKVLLNLLQTLQMEKAEDEKQATYSDRLLTETKRLLNLWI